MSPSRSGLLQAILRTELESLPDRPTSTQSDSPPESAITLPSTTSIANGLPSEVPNEQAVAPITNTSLPLPNTDGSCETIDTDRNTPKGTVISETVDDPCDEDLKPRKPSPNGTRVPECALTRGDLVHLNQSFCPIVAFSKFPYQFTTKKYSESVADAFFNGGKFWERTWDIYYFWAPESAKPLLLITELQAQTLIKEINDFFKDTGFQIILTSEQRHDSGLVIEFREPHPHLRPRYLGRSYTREEYKDMEYQVPSPEFRPHGEAEVGPPDNRTLEAFNEWYEEQAQKQKSKYQTAKAKKKEERIVLQRGFVKQLKRAQRYLGLRPKKPLPPLQDPALSGLSPADLQAAQAKWEVETRLPPIDVLQPSPYEFDSSVVFIAIDVEAWERNQKMITEVGVSVLDTLDVLNVAPGKDAEAWRKKIRTRHFWITENMHLRNHDFVSGCPEHFEFGQSEKVSLNEARSEIAACFRPPYCSISRPNSTAKRNIILVGHDPNQDIRYLASMGSNPLDNRDNILEILDTAVVYKTWKRETQAPSLGSILYDFGIVGWNLHNAGNDAHYTMEALLAIVVHEASLNGTKKLQEQRDLQKEAKVLEATAVAAEIAQERLEGWSSAGEDGGEPIAPEKNEIVPPPVGVVGRDGTTYYDNNSRGSRGGRRGSGQSRARGLSQTSQRSYAGKSQEDWPELVDGIAGVLLNGHAGKSGGKHGCGQVNAPSVSINGEPGQA